MLEGHGWTEVRRPQLDETRRCWRARSLSGAPGRRQGEEVGLAGGGEVAWREGEIPRGACLVQIPHGDARIACRIPRGAL